MAQLPQREQQPELIVDSTGVGRPVIDAMRDAGLRPIGITITGGVDVLEKAPDDWRVPKRVLASTMQVALQTGRLKVAANMPLTTTLMKELQAFRVKINVNANTTYEAWREQDHDDLVLASALAAWSAESRARTPRYDDSMNWVYDSAEQIANLAMMFRD
jgi:hypothetical protein